jgi:hypothetical protein
MTKRDENIASLFKKNTVKKNSSSSSIISNDAMDYDEDIGSLVRTTDDSRISGDIVHLFNLINDLRTSEDNVGRQHTPTPS